MTVAMVQLLPLATAQARCNAACIGRATERAEDRGAGMCSVIEAREFADRGEEGGAWGFIHASKFGGTIFRAKIIQVARVTFDYRAMSGRVDQPRTSDSAGHVRRALSAKERVVRGANDIDDRGRNGDLAMAAQSSERRLRFGK